MLIKIYLFGCKYEGGLIQAARGRDAKNRQRSYVIELGVTEYIRRLTSNYEGGEGESFTRSESSESGACGGPLRIQLTK